MHARQTCNHVSFTVNITREHRWSHRPRLIQTRSNPQKVYSGQPVLGAASLTIETNTVLICSFHRAGCAVSLQIRHTNIQTRPRVTCCDAQVPLEVNKPTTFRHVRFSLDGKWLAASVEGRLYMLDAFEGHVKATMHTGMPAGSAAPEPTFSPDSKFLLSGVPGISASSTNRNPNVRSTSDPDT